MCHKANGQWSIIPFYLGPAVGYFTVFLIIKLMLMSQPFMFKNFKPRYIVALKQWKNCELTFQIP